MDILKKLGSLVGPDSHIWTPPAGYESNSNTNAIPRTEQDLSQKSIASMDDPSLIPTQHDFVTSLHAANAVMSCLELLLMRKDTVALLVKMGGFPAIKYPYSLPFPISF